MIKIKKKHRTNIIFFIVILLMIIPQTRQQLQIAVHKGLALFGPSINKEKESKILTDYDWVLRDENGKNLNFNEVKGNVIIVNFWATWCPPCIAEMPSFEKLYDTYQEDVVFLFVSNENHQVIADFKLKHDYAFLVYSAISESPEAFETSSIPRTFLIDREGHILIDKSGAADWNSKSVNMLIKSLLD